ncbi:hypothetical protein H4R19_004479 [Coemansia spiralis]|nr:hypothetical protein H4R19_004479 [Coemansia spiralis]
MAASARAAFLEYCGAGGQPVQQEAARQELVRQLEALRIEMSRHNSAHECARELPEAGPLLATLCRSRAIARSSDATRAVVDTAMEYSKALRTGVYANKRATHWFAQLVQSLLAAGSSGGGVHRRMYETPDFALFADEVVAREHSVRLLVQLLAGARGGWDAAARERMWDDAFAVCCGADRVVLFERLLPAIDECGWARLAKHRLAADHGVLLLSRLPLAHAVTVWSRLETVRAQLVLHLLDGRGPAAGIERLLDAVLGDEALAGGMADDIARLVLATRDARVVELWRRVCRGRRCALRVLARDPDPDGPRAEDVSELFCGSPSPAAEDEIDIAQTRLYRQWRCIADVQARGSPSAALRMWLAAVAASDAGHGFAFRVLDGHFGGGPAPGSAAAVVRREAALDVAAFLWAPLGGDAPATARDGVLALWQAQRAAGPEPRGG